MGARTVVIMNLIVSSVLFLVGLDFLYGAMGPLPYAVVSIGGLFLMQPCVQQALETMKRKNVLLILALITVLAFVSVVLLTLYAAPVIARQSVLALSVLTGMHFFERVSSR